jgi:hypothetical protein
MTNWPLGISDMLEINIAGEGKWVRGGERYDLFCYVTLMFQICHDKIFNNNRTS